MHNLMKYAAINWKYIIQLIIPLKHINFNFQTQEIFFNIK